MRGQNSGVEDTDQNVSFRASPPSAMTNMPTRSRLPRRPGSHHGLALQYVTLQRAEGTSPPNRSQTGTLFALPVLADHRGHAFKSVFEVEQSCRCLSLHAADKHRTCRGAVHRSDSQHEAVGVSSQCLILLVGCAKSCAGQSAPRKLAHPMARAGWESTMTISAAHSPVRCEADLRVCRSATLHTLTVACCTQRHVQRPGACAYM